MLTLLLTSGAFASEFEDTLAKAKAGLASAQSHLGYMYLVGKGIPENDAEAVKWFRKAAEQGNAIAQGNLGYMYDLGKGIPENDAEAVKWYRKAAEQGNANAQKNLGISYGNGEGIRRNNIKAYVWYSMAKTQGEKVKNSIVNLKNLMTTREIAQAQKLAATCWESEFKDCD